MTASHSRQGLRRRSLTALPLLLVPLLMTACSSPAGSASPGSAASSGSSASTAAPSTAAGADLYKTYSTSKQFCALVSVADVSAAMQVTPAYPAAKPASSPVECTYDNGSVHSIVSVEWSPKGDGQLDSFLEVPDSGKATAIDVGGHEGRLLASQHDVQVVVGDAAIDVFGLSGVDPKREAALAAAFAQKVG